MNRRNVFIVALALAVTMVAGEARADNCGPSDREDLPDCVDNDVGSREYEVENQCGETVTLKVDLKGWSDDRFNLYDNTKKSYRIGNTKYNLGVRINSVKCCPRYNRCDFDEDE